MNKRSERRRPKSETFRRLILTGSLMAQARGDHAELSEAWVKLLEECRKEGAFNDNR